MSDSESDRVSRRKRPKRKIFVVESDSSSDSGSSIEQNRRKKRVPLNTSSSNSSSSTTSSSSSSLNIVRRSTAREPSIESSSSFQSDDFEWNPSDSSGENLRRRENRRANRVLSDSDSCENQKSSSRYKTKNPLMDFEESSSSGNDAECEKCPICLIKIKTQEIGTPESCDHSFCVECILEWSNNSNTCPVDRQEFTLILVRKHLNGKVIRNITVTKRNLDIPPLEVNETFCEICGQSDREDRMLLCDGCDLGFHMECLTPPLEEVPLNEWYCERCALQRANGMNAGENFSLLNDFPPGDRDFQDETIGIRRMHLLITSGGRSLNNDLRSFIDNIESSSGEGHAENEHEEENYNYYQPSTSSYNNDVPSTSRANQASTSSGLKKRKKSRKRKKAKTCTLYKVDAVTAKVYVVKKSSRKKRRRRKRKQQRLNAIVRAVAKRQRSVKTRLATRLGVCAPRFYRQTMPELKSQHNVPDTINFHRYQAGIPTLSLFGSRNSLSDYSDESDNNEDETSLGGGQINIMSRAAARNTLMNVTMRRQNRLKGGLLIEPQPSEIPSRVDQTPCNILDSILDSQAKFHSKTSTLSLSKNGVVQVVDKKQNLDDSLNTNADMNSKPIDIDTNSSVQEKNGNLTGVAKETPMYPGYSGNRPQFNQFNRGGGGYNRGGSGGNHFSGGAGRGNIQQRGNFDFNRNSAASGPMGGGGLNDFFNRGVPSLFRSGPPNPHRGRGAPRFPTTNIRHQQPPPPPLPLQSGSPRLPTGPIFGGPPPSLSRPFLQPPRNERLFQPDISSSSESQYPENLETQVEESDDVDIYSDIETKNDDEQGEGDDNTNEPFLNPIPPPPIPPLLPSMFTGSDDEDKNSDSELVIDDKTKANLSGTSQKGNNETEEIYDPLNPSNDSDSDVDDENQSSVSNNKVLQTTPAVKIVGPQLPSFFESQKQFGEVTTSQGGNIEFISQTDANYSDDDDDNRPIYSVETMNIAKTCEQNLEMESTSKLNEMESNQVAQSSIECPREESLEPDSQQDSNEVVSTKKSNKSAIDDEAPKIEIINNVLIDDLNSIQLPDSCESFEILSSSTQSAAACTTNQIDSDPNANQSEEISTTALSQGECISSSDAEKDQTETNETNSPPMKKLPIKIDFKKDLLPTSSSLKCLQLYDDSDFEDITDSTRVEEENKLELDKEQVNENITSNINEGEDKEEPDRSYTPLLDEKRDDSESLVCMGIGGLDTELVSEDEKNDFDDFQDTKTTSDGEALEINAKENELELSGVGQLEDGEINENKKKSNLKKSDFDQNNKENFDKNLEISDDDRNKESTSSSKQFKRTNKITKDRNYRDKDRSKSKETKKEIKNKPSKRDKKRELERYDVRSVVGQRAVKDKFGRDEGIRERSRSLYRTPERMRHKTPIKSGKKRRDSISRSRSRSQRRYSLSPKLKSPLRSRSLTNSPIRDLRRSRSKRSRSRGSHKSLARSRNKKSLSRTRKSLSRRRSISRRSLSRSRRSRSRRSLSRGGRKSHSPRVRRSISPRTKRKSSISPHKRRNRKRSRSISSSSSSSVGKKRSGARKASPRNDSYSRRKRSLSPVAPKNKKRKTKSKSRERLKKSKAMKNKRNNNKNRRHSSISPINRDRYLDVQSPILDTIEWEKSATRYHHRNWSPLVGQIERRSWSRSISPQHHGIMSQSAAGNVSPSWTPPIHSLNNIGQANLTVYLRNDEVSKKKKEKRKKRDKRSKDRQKSSKRRMVNESTPPPSKEVFASGDNILVSLNFNKDNNDATTTIAGNTSSSRRKRDDDDVIGSNKKSKKEKKKQTSSSSGKKKKNKNSNVPNVKPVAIIDLASSPFKELTPSPRDVIVLSDSDPQDLEDTNGGDREDLVNHEENIQQMEDDSVPQSPMDDTYSTPAGIGGQGPKTPPEPQIKFLIQKPQQLLQNVINPLRPDDDEEDNGNEENNVSSQIAANADINADIDPQEELEMRLNETISHQKKGPNTPPEPPNSPPSCSSPDAYDPFEPTKSRSPTPEQESNENILESECNVVISDLGNSPAVEVQTVSSKPCNSMLNDDSGQMVPNSPGLQSNIASEQQKNATEKKGNSSSSLSTSSLEQSVDLSGQQITQNNLSSSEINTATTAIEPNSSRQQIVQSSTQNTLKNATSISKTTSATTTSSVLSKVTTTSSSSSSLLQSNNYDNDNDAVIIVSSTTGISSSANPRQSYFNTSTSSLRTNNLQKNNSGKTIKTPLKTSVANNPVKKSTITSTPKQTTITKLPMPSIGNNKPTQMYTRNNTTKIKANNSNVNFKSPQKSNNQRNNSGKNNSNENGIEVIEVDLDFDSPYSPGSSDFEDLFEPPSQSEKTAMRNQQQTKKSSHQQGTTAFASNSQTNKQQTASNLFDSLFGDVSPVYKATKKSNAANNSSSATKAKNQVKFSKKSKGLAKNQSGKLDEESLIILDELPNSAVELQVKDKFLKKLYRQERVVEEVKLVLKPHYNKKHITKEQYKDILRRSVPKICHNKTGEINPQKIQNLIEAYVKRARTVNKKLASIQGAGNPNSAKLNLQKQAKTSLWS